ncbi:MAG: hypothetical protein RIT27_1817 [Pseudomonadota bacterium]|jgi:probable phosphoglycerate mutase
MSETRIFLVRHGETAWNLEGRMQGHLDVPLTEIGIEQAKAAAEELSGISFDGFYCSDLQRAFQTAQQISSKIKQPPQALFELRERNLGILQGFTRNEAIEHYPDVVDAYLNNPDFVIPKGESSRDFMQRCITIINQLAKQHLNQNILMVTHGGFVGNVLKYVLEIPISAPRRFKVLNTSINTFLYNETGWILESWGTLKHIARCGDVDDM